MERLKIQPARVKNGVIEIEQGGEFLPAEDGILISAGQADSIGFVIIGINSCRYISNTQIDAAYMLETMAAICEQLAAVGNTITFAIPSVGVAPNIELVAIAVEVNALKLQIEAKKLI
jgi:hypothetical protein